MFKRIFTMLLLLTGYFSCVNGQTYNGPDSGGVASGAIISTDNFSKNTSIVEPKEQIWNEETEFSDDQSEYIDFGYQTPKEGSNYFEDTNAENLNGSTPYPFLLNDFAGIPMGNSIPPDPYLAVGPDNIIAVVNTSFRIYDKEGNILKTITADSWFNNVFPSAGAFDPKVTYDIIDQRWIMVWLEQHAGTSHLLVSVSDDSDPLGTWYNWALPGNLNGTVNSNTWTDYQGVGYDQDAIYITGNQFTFTTPSYFQYGKIRIIPKAQLYLNTGGPCSWQDIWNINGGDSYTIRPSIMYSSSSKYYLVQIPSSTANYIRLYSITNPLTSPALTLNNIPVTAFSSPPDASQLGGGTPLIDCGGGSLKNEPKFRDGFLYLVHTVRNPSNTQYSALHYLKINTNTNTPDQDYVFGANGFWHFFPSVDVDLNGNVAMAYSRSGTTEYAGAFFTGRLANDPAGFMGSQPLAEGLGHYIVTFSGERNRWGDYTGIVLDPVDQTNFWALSEYAAATNTWGTRVGKIRVEPWTGSHLISKIDSLDFGNVEAGMVGDTLAIGMANYGTDDVVITDIPSVLGPFNLLNDLSFPLTLGTYDSLTIQYVFRPLTVGPFSETLTISSNTTFQDIPLKGRGYEINPAVRDNFYAVSGSVNEGSLYTINMLTGAGNLIGNANYDDVDAFKSLTIDPHTGIMYGLTNVSGNAVITRINSEAGDAYTAVTLPLNTDMNAIAFDTSGTLYGFLKSKDIYTIDLATGEYNFKVASDVILYSAAFDPVNNVLYATSYVLIGSNKDRIYTVDLTSGNTTIIGNTGFNTLTNDLDFDPAGNLYGVIGPQNQDNDFISIDKTTGTGTIIGSINYPNITGLVYSRSGLTGTIPSHETQLPKDYSLKQNYPNPFNPSTRIEYTLPVTAGVKVVIYNLLGEVVNVLVNSQQNAGVHSVVWNSEDMHGSKVGSGVYFYEFKANGSNGSDFTQIRKMILLK